MSSMAVIGSRASAGAGAGTSKGAEEIEDTSAADVTKLMKPCHQAEVMFDKQNTWYIG